MRMLEGIYPATVTPFGDDGMFSPQLMAKIIRYQLDTNRAHYPHIELTSDSW